VSETSSPRSDSGSALVQRPRLLSRLEESALPLVLVSAPSGYGKSVLIGQWSDRDPRPYPTLILGDEHNDPAMLIGSIVAALDPIEAVAREVGTALANPKPNIKKVVLPRLGDSLERRQVPFVLVLDDFERIRSVQALDVVKSLVAHVPPGSQVVLASRTEPELAIGRLRVQGGVNELGAAELVMTKGECQELLGALGLRLKPEQLETLVRRTEGWPAALHLAGLALRDVPDLEEAIARFAGDDRFVVDYIREEFLESASRRQLDFLRRASILDRLSGDLCDSVLQRRGSATQLRELSRTNMLITPLDRHDDWFRLHPLFREMLRAELRRSEPEEEAGLDRRASDWWAGHGDWDRAISHAVDAGALDRAGELLWTGIPEFTTRGRNATIIGWLDRLGERAIATDAALSLTASYAQITQGAGGKTEYWAAVAAGLIEKEPASDKRTVLTAGLGLIEAALARGGVGAIADRTALAAEMLPADSPWMSMCRLVEGVGLHLQGRRDEAHEKLADGARRGAISAPNVQVLCLSQLALLAIEADDWTLAEMLASQARAQLDRSGIDEYPMMALALSVSAVVRSRTGRLEAAAADLRQGKALLERLEDFAPWYEAETWIALARASVRLGDAPAATLMLGEASRVLKLTPDATVLGEWIAATALSIEAVSASAIRDLTPAEMHILQYLPTHLSFPQIAGQVFVSPNTVKTQAQSVYRKLGVTSRREAVEQARAAGLLNPDGPESDTVQR
jgi:LuxR family maltose regulon positive regulatory protein